MGRSNRKERLAFRFEIVFDDSDGYMSGPVLDISETGCFIETVMPLPPGKRVILTPLLEGEAGNHELVGEVVRTNTYDADEIGDGSPGMGVRFIDPNPEFIAVLRAAFEENR